MTLTAILLGDPAPNRLERAEARRLAILDKRGIRQDPPAERRRRLLAHVVASAVPVTLTDICDEIGLGYGDARDHAKALTDEGALTFINGEGPQAASKFFSATPKGRMTVESWA
ncbi:hypothetical protein V7S57_02355 [Caulobacter sp. CCNWLY153]|uniref:hypothetical protein n=1 Tax=unclassified Caulobacter TaxID=2648921 RepID=UPI002FF1E399